MYSLYACNEKSNILIMRGYACDCFSIANLIFANRDYFTAGKQYSFCVDGNEYNGFCLSRIVLLDDCKIVGEWRF